MANYTTKTYSMKREIVNFSKDLTKNLPLPVKKFITDMNYGMLASNSCLLSDIADTLHEETKKKNTIERLALNLEKGIPDKLNRNYLKKVKNIVGKEPVVHIDDTDIVKPCGRKFEDMGRVRDGSESSSEKNVYKNGYYVTEACALTTNNHPVSVFSKIHSSREEDYISTNAITFQAIDESVKLFKKATFVMDRGYDADKIFFKLEKLRQEYIVRLTVKRKVVRNNRKISVSELCNRRKGKIKITVRYNDKDYDAYLSHVKVQLKEDSNYVYLVLVYGVTEHPMMLLTNKEIKSKEDVIRIARLYFSRWRIEEYFRSKKQIFGFEKFRVRSMVSIRSLTFMITAYMTFLALMSMKSVHSSLKIEILSRAAPLKQKMQFYYYRIAKGNLKILSYARMGVKGWFKIKRQKYRQLAFSFLS
ncbi:MAG TPA: transposase [Clostridia bacterium]|nr:transposase [Clostridia bacterium]